MLAIFSSASKASLGNRRLGKMTTLTFAFRVLQSIRRLVDRSHMFHPICGEVVPVGAS